MENQMSSVWMNRAITSSAIARLRAPLGGGIRVMIALARMNGSARASIPRKRGRWGCGDGD